jgi:hypothetical protein
MGADMSLEGNALKVLVLRVKSQVAFCELPGKFLFDSPRGGEVACYQFEINKKVSRAYRRDGRCSPPADWCAAEAGAAFYHRRTEAPDAEVFECEVAACGGIPAGMMAAIQAARAGRKTMLLSFNESLAG